MRLCLQLVDCIYWTRDELFKMCREEMESRGEWYLWYSQFTRLWKLKFDNVLIPRKVWMGVCALCANLKSMIKGEKMMMHKKKVINIFKGTSRQSSKEKIKAMHHRDKAL